MAFECVLKNTKVQGEASLQASLSTWRARPRVDFEEPWAITNPNANQAKHSCPSLSPGPEQNLEHSLEDLREAARLMPTSAVLTYAFAALICAACSCKEKRHQVFRFRDPCLPPQLQRTAAESQVLDCSCYSGANLDMHGVQPSCTSRTLLFSEM